ncbi:MAG: hypothetical protein M1133_14290 [Armatimonadetes bacterium]|nr:hypothetical protein [Armatimonadota bacterium]
MANFVKWPRFAWGFVFALSVITPGAHAAVVGPETPIAPTFGAAPGMQESVSMAVGSNGYLAVWQDQRGLNGADIFGSRISPSGQVLDVFAIAICASMGDQTQPSVAWDGRQYLVVWADRRGANQHVYGARVLDSGVVLDPQGFLISGTVADQTNPRAAGDGSGCLVVWQDSRGASPDIYGCKVSSDGIVGKTYGISTRSDNEETPDVAYNGSTYLVVWRDYRNMISSDTDIYGCRVSKTAIRTGADILISCTPDGTAGAPGAQRAPRVCGFGSTWMVVWEDLRTDSTHSDIYGARVSSAGTVYDKGGIAISTMVGDQELPSVGFDGGKLLVAWRDRTDRLVKGARLGSTGILLDNSAIAISPAMAGSSGTAVAGMNSKFVVCWSSLNATNSDVLSSMVSDAGVVQSPAGTVVSMGLMDQADYSVADNGDEYAVVWSQMSGGYRKIMGARVSHAGTVLAAAPINITGTYSGDQAQPSIAWNGTKYLLVWTGSETYGTSSWDIRGWFLDTTLMPIGATPITICSAIEDQVRPSVASNHNNFLVVWEDARNAVSPDYVNDIYGAVISSAGTVTPTSPAISLAAGFQYVPKAATDGANYFVVWEDHRGTGAAIYGARVNSSAQVQDANGILVPATSSYQVSPSICYGNGGYFVAWADSNKISGCRISSTGSILDANGITISAGSKPKAAPGVFWDGSKYQVVWEDYRSSDPSNSDIYGTSLNANGVVSPLPEMALVSDLAPQLRPQVLAFGGSGLLMYSKFVNYADALCAVTLTDSVIQELDKISAAKGLSTGAMVSLSGKVVMAAFTDYFYIEEPDRTSGIRVIGGIRPNVNDLVDVIGTVSIADGERQINAGQAVTMGTASDPPRPLAIRGDWLGGAGLNSYTPGITGGCGLNNVGLLVTTWGKVVSTGTGYFYIECKPGVTVRVKSGSLTIPAVDKVVSITGISSCELLSGNIARAIIPRTQSDIRILH